MEAAEEPLKLLLLLPPIPEAEVGEGGEALAAAAEAAVEEGVGGRLTMAEVVKS